MTILPLYAQTSNTIGFVQIILRDSQENLVTSFEVTTVGYIYHAKLTNFLDIESSQNDPVIIVENQKMQIIERKATLNFDSKDVVSDATLNTAADNGQIIPLIRLIHDGIPVVPGDQLISIWTFIRPVT